MVYCEIVVGFSELNVEIFIFFEEFSEEEGVDWCYWKIFWFVDLLDGIKEFIK